MAKAKLSYCPDSLNIFEGFYESCLYNSDMEYNYNCNLEEGEPECELDDFRAFKDEVGEAAVERLSEVIGEDDEIMSGLKFDHISSPAYYNFTTDKLVMNADIDLEALKEWVLEDNDRIDGFDDYLREKYSSRDGFLSFVPNNVDDYFEDSYDQYYDVLVDYYVLTKIYGDNPDVVWCCLNKSMDSDYHWRLYEDADEIFYMHMRPVSDEAV